MNAGDMLDEERLKDDERDALADVDVMIALLEHALRDAKLAKSAQGEFDGERSAVVALYRRACWWVQIVQDRVANAPHEPRRDK